MTASDFGVAPGPEAPPAPGPARTVAPLPPELARAEARVAAAIGTPAASAWPSPAASTPRRCSRWRSARSGPRGCSRSSASRRASPPTSGAAAHAVARFVGAPVVEVVTHEGDWPAYRANGPDRCFHCKDELFTRIDDEVRRPARARRGGLRRERRRRAAPGPARVARRGHRHGVLRPLADAGLDKAAVRRIARALGAAVRGQAGRAVPGVAHPAPRAGHAGEARPGRGGRDGRCATLGLPGLPGAPPRRRRAGRAARRTRSRGPPPDAARARSTQAVAGGRVPVRRRRPGRDPVGRVHPPAGGRPASWLTTGLATRRQELARRSPSSTWTGPARRGYPEAVLLRGQDARRRWRPIAAAAARRRGARTLFTRADAGARRGRCSPSCPTRVHAADCGPAGLAGRAAGAGGGPGARRRGRHVRPRRRARGAAHRARTWAARAELVMDVGVAGLHRVLGSLDAAARGPGDRRRGRHGRRAAGVVAGLVAAPVVAVPTSTGYGAAFEGLARAADACSTAARPGWPWSTSTTATGPGTWPLRSPRRADRVRRAGPGGAGPQPGRRGRGGRLVEDLAHRHAAGPGQRRRVLELGGGHRDPPARAAPPSPGPRRRPARPARQSRSSADPVTPAPRAPRASPVSAKTIAAQRRPAPAPRRARRGCGPGGPSSSRSARARRRPRPAVQQRGQHGRPQPRVQVVHVGLQDPHASAAARARRPAGGAEHDADDVGPLRRRPARPRRSRPPRPPSPAAGRSAAPARAPAPARSAWPARPRHRASPPSRGRARAPPAPARAGRRARRGPDRSPPRPGSR